MISVKVIHLGSEEFLEPLWISLSAAVKQAMALELTSKPLLRENQCFYKVSVNKEAICYC